MSVFVIAEAGVNHNGDVELAKRLIDVAAAAGADAVKFQTFRAEQLVSRSAPKAAYQKRATGTAESQLEMLRRLELGPAQHETLIAHAAERGIEFLSTPFDSGSLQLLTERFGLRTIKIPSGEVTNTPFVLEIARVAQRAILSTGMSTLGEIEAALGALAFGFSGSTEKPGPEAFERAFASAAGRRAVQERVTLLHCTTEYPAPAESANLRALQTLAAAFGTAVGYSDHTTGLHVSLAAVALGARVIEKHFTLDRALPGPDHAASLEPAELTAFVRQIRDIEAALGDGIKCPTAAEWDNRSVARQTLVAAAAIRAGDELTARNVTYKRAGGGMSAARYWSVLGRRASRSYEVDDALDE
jgi:N-acetylneuraminate synthase